ncbi:UDP-N-acetylenolpyruvoylglucosamine reductase [Pueribacillus theae]|uniref:UDP-N-acetylenolpyruvoylglucosamine reductase n=1 Tax=Pueribacillus theae TaxID=2171751 RepID=A0A2U1K7A7_9BACI|nr:UDP-N-acetylmuramate dehydrogenase [Pueribacillus theae]PWA13410.1 UDP-N-acetylenolpyruvoylglucosamine reductase [Pueribacillus theae]
MEKLAEKLIDADIGKVLLDEPLANHTTIKIGGPAELYVEPKDIESLKRLMAFIREENIQWFVIGRGSNLLVKDGGIKGVVINLAKGIEHLEITGETIKVGGGYPLVKLATLISKKGLSGLEFAGGIPGSVGGAVYMNAGAHGSDISKITTRVHVLYPDGSMRWLSNEEMKFSYRTSILQSEPGIVVEAEMKLKEDDKETVTALMKKHKDYRRETQPWNDPCCGSVFRNPLPEHSGALIERAGLKGTKMGGVQISEMHGNFIVNIKKGVAKAQDVLDLIELVKKTIKEKYDIELETEVEVVGDP